MLGHFLEKSLEIVLIFLKKNARLWRQIGSGFPSSKLVLSFFAQSQCQASGFDAGFRRDALQERQKHTFYRPDFARPGIDFCNSQKCFPG